MLVTRENFDEAVNLIKNTSGKERAYCAVFGKEDSYAVKSEYIHLYSCSISKDYKPFHATKGYNHNELVTTEQTLLGIIEQEYVEDICLIICKNDDKHEIDDNLDFQRCMEKSRNIPKEYDFDAIEKAEAMPIITGGDY